MVTEGGAAEVVDLAEVIAFAEVVEPKPELVLLAQLRLKVLRVFLKPPPVSPCQSQLESESLVIGVDASGSVLYLDTGSPCLRYAPMGR